MNFCEKFFPPIKYCEITTASAEKYLLPRSASLTEFWALGGWELELERAFQSALLLLLLRLRAYQRISEYYAAFSASVEILHFRSLKLLKFIVDLSFEVSSWWILQTREVEFSLKNILPGLSKRMITQRLVSRMMLLYLLEP